MTSGQEAEASGLTGEILRLNEMSMSLRQRLLDRFVKAKDEEPVTSEAPEPNPIDYLIRKTVETQLIIKKCIELVEGQVINKLEGGGK